MSLPNQLKSNRVQQSTIGSDTPALIDAIEQAVCDILGIPIDTLVSNPLFAAVAGGLIKVILRDAAADPTAAGELLRSGTRLKYHDGSLVQTIATLSDTAGFAKILKTDGDFLPPTSGTWYDIPGLSVTITTGAHRCRVSFVGVVSSTTTVYFRAKVDGADVENANSMLVGYGNFLNASFWLVTDVLALSAHTFKVQMKYDNFAVLTASSTLPARLTAEELPY